MFHIRLTSACTRIRRMSLAVVLAVGALAFGPGAQAAIIPPPDYDFTFPGALIKANAVSPLFSPTTMPGWLTLDGLPSSVTDPVSGVSVAASIPGNQHRGNTMPVAHQAHPLANVLRNNFQTGNNTATITISGLDQNTSYDIFIISYRGTNNAIWSHWYRDTTDPQNHIVSIFNAGSDATASPNDAMRIFSQTSDSAGQIVLLMHGDSAVASGESYFSGIVVIPEPSSLALLGLAGLLGLRRRRNNC